MEVSNAFALWVESRDLLDGYKNKTLTNQLNAFYNATWNDYFSSELNLDYVRNKNEYDQSVTERNEQLDMTTNSDATGHSDIYAGQFTVNYAKDNWLTSSVPDFNANTAPSTLSSEHDSKDNCAAKISNMYVNTFFIRCSLLLITY